MSVQLMVHGGDIDGDDVNGTWYMLLKMIE